MTALRGYGTKQVSMCCNFKYSSGRSVRLRLSTALLIIGLITMASFVQQATAKRARRPKGSTPRQEAGGNANAGANSRVGNPAASTENSRERSRPGKLSVLKTSQRAKFLTEKEYLKKDWCKSRPVRQHITTKTGCKGELINHFCYGQCNSFYIPKDIEYDGSEGVIEPQYFKSCSFCKPKSEEIVDVRLRCKRKRRKDGGRKKRGKRYLKIKIRRIKGCRCISVPELETLQPPTPLDTEADSSRSNAQHATNSTAASPGTISNR